MKHLYLSLVALAILLSSTSCQPNTNSTNHVSDNSQSTTNAEVNHDSLVMISDKHYIDGFPALANDDLVNVVIEIPSGTVAKWEVDKLTGNLKWTLLDGLPRNVDYLGYPGNYGMIPQTLLNKQEGGDGDPLDVIVLGPAIPRGDVMACRLVGVIELLDNGEQDDKIIAIDPRSAFQDIHTMAGLREHFPGAIEILETWFRHYKGPGIIEIKGLGEADRANTILRQAMEGYTRSKTQAE